MGLEIERKFLVATDAWRVRAGVGRRLRQGYLSTGGGAAVRVRTAEDEAWLTIKAATAGTTRAEFEYPIPVADAQAMLATLCGDRLIDKVRHEVVDGGRRWEVDCFEGRHAGLVVAEVELEAADAELELPAWVGREVTGERRYYNAELALDPSVPPKA